jgi:hypothetical protein
MKAVDIVGAPFRMLYDIVKWSVEVVEELGNTI